MNVLGNLVKPTGQIQFLAAAFLAVGAAATVGTALGFEHIGGYIPCALCLKERIPYYMSVPIGLIAVLSAYKHAPGILTRGLIALIGLIMVYGLVLAIYHTGVEWQFWAGPTDCGAAAKVDMGGDLLSTIDQIHPPACDTAAGRFLGLSFAGWNVLSSAFFAVIALYCSVARGEKTKA